LKLSREVIADIFLGKIKTWDDPKITSLNPNMKIPKINITVVRRSDGSGTTDIFTHFLSLVSPEWKEKVGAGTSVNWITGIGGRGNMGVAGYIKNIVGTIGYLELTYAVQNNLPYAMVKNKAGNFVYPEIPNIEAALENFPVQKDFYVYPIDAKGKDSYPISGYTFLLIRKNQGNLEKAKALISLVNWIYKEGDKTAKDLYYVPLPQKVKSMALERLKELNYQGKPIH
ncbi:MAG TPA: phosphate ABC transporter substrate-binding protein PstS, partial [Dictyoglomaceae bacterium]|nr:phosphate ABC transporter substrate-binding protein PstS [Dictyoglomaceae bacterium]